MGSTPKGSPPDPLMRSTGWTTLTTCNIRDTMEGASSAGEAGLRLSNEGVWAMAEEGVGAGAAWRDEPKHRSGGEAERCWRQGGPGRAGVPW